MSIEARTYGLATVKVDTGVGDALENLGYTRGGVELVGEQFTAKVPGDENGGDDGPPVEIQELGEIHRVRCELTKYDTDVSAKIEARLKGGTPGTKATPGELIFANEKYFRLCISAPGGVRNYPRAVPSLPIEHNRGTKFSVLVIEFECHAPPGGGVLYNETGD